jgi:hypothetical protein
VACVFTLDSALAGPPHRDLPASACSCNVSHAWNGLRQSLWNNGGSADVVRDFFDINGDGLPEWWTPAQMED